MRKMIASEFVPLDGVMEAPDQWHFPYFDEEMGQEIVTAMGQPDAMLMGRNLATMSATHRPAWVVGRNLVSDPEVGTLRYPWYPPLGFRTLDVSCAQVVPTRGRSN
jgi:hypothetical protein